MPLEVSRLTIDLEEAARWRRILSVTVPADLVRAERQEIARTLAARVKLPGFRSGRVPASVVEKRYGSAVQREVVDKLVGEAYRGALQVHGLHPISEGEVENLDYEPDQDLTFRISFDVQPQIELARLGGFAAERAPTDVSAEETDRVLQRLREQNGTWVPAPEGHPQAGDLVEVSVTRLEDGEPADEPQVYDLVLGSGDAIPDVENAIRALEPGGEGEFTVTFPEDFPNENRRGDTEHLRVELRERKIRELPELDDEFARSVGDFEDLEALRTRVEADLRKEASDRAEAGVRGQILEFLIEANPFEVPSSMVDRYLDSVLGEPSDDDEERLREAREKVRPDAERAVKRILLVDRVAETQGLAASETEVDERVEEIAASNGTTPAEVYARLQKSGGLDQLEREITERRVFEFLLSKSEIQEASS